MTFGKHLQALRKEKGLSQDALANQLYVTRQSVSQWENDRTMPSVDLLLKLSEIYGTTVDALLGKPQTESIPQPVASARTLHSKKEIRDAMRWESATATIVMLSLTLLFFCVALTTYLFEQKLYSPEIATYRVADPLNARYYAIVGFLCLAAAVVTAVIGAVNTIKAVRFGRSHCCTLQFFFDHLVIEEEGTEPLRLFYANIKRIVETDACFILRMQNNVRMCVKKSELENAAAVSKLLKSSRNHFDRRLRKSDTPLSRLGRCLIRAVRDALFVATFFTATFYSINFGILSTVLVDNQPLRLVLFAIPFVLLAAEIAVGIVFTVRGIRAKRMIIAGGVGLTVLAVIAVPTNFVCTLYNFQHDRVTAEQFTAYMEAHGLEVENTIKGRQETFISRCFTARPQNKGFEILYMEFDPYSSGHGLFSAYETYGKLQNEIISQPRTFTRYKVQDLGFNRFYTERTNNHYAYVSLNEYSVICINTSPEREEDVQTVLKDWTLALPY